ncbi:MAG TPA: acyl-CoA thioester hydrolase/BAAT C-terminal domain-containing protein [Candidatus Sulfotelmatobacter sp.]|nr:acyl-CoA thioester hydrolase/BAAT C-terminal domain-containing protein [Candidatus Sulfotelmatobacter sp.]
MHIRIRGLSPQQKITIHATAEDDDRRKWTSHAEFRADSSGSVDAAAQESLGGTYRGISPMGLFWSMHLDSAEPQRSSIFSKKDASPNRVTFEFTNSGHPLASAQLNRIYLAPEIQTRDLKVNGHAGKLFLPPGPGPHPAVVVLKGTGGGYDLDKAAALSRHGIATLALAYLGIPPLPNWLHRIPLEYFEAALEWLGAQPEIDAQRIGVLGVSRGAELALLLAAAYPQIRAVVAYAPSSVAWAAGGRDKSTGEIIPSWTHNNRPIPFAPLPLQSFMLRSAFPVVVFRRPVIFRNLFRSGLQNLEESARAAIAVEKIRGPLLLISGGDDHLWPAAEMSEAIVERLKRHRFAHALEHLHYPRAGHMLRYPHLPTTSRKSGHPQLRDACYSFGGTPEADAEAQADSWRRSIAFLRAHL